MPTQVMLTAEDDQTIIRLRGLGDDAGLAFQFSSCTEAASSSEPDTTDSESGMRFVDNVAHEFRTPLSVIREYSSLLTERLLGELNDEQDEFISIVGDRAEDLSNMVDDLLDSCRADAGLLCIRRRSSEFRDIIDRVYSVLDRKSSIRGVSLHLQLPEDLPSVYCDPEKTSRIVMNLVINAIKLTPEGGEISVWARHDFAQNNVVVGVTDNGSGLRPDDLARVVERFQQINARCSGRTKGFGLGLNIANELVDLSFGQMSVESEFGVGSTFSFTMPITNVTVVSERYLARVMRNFGQTSSAVIMRVDVDTTVESAATEEISALLESVLSTDDLIWQVSTHSWLLLSPAARRDAQQLETAIRNEAFEVSRNRPTGELPELQIAAIQRNCAEIDTARIHELPS